MAPIDQPYIDQATNELNPDISAAKAKLQAQLDTAPVDAKTETDAINPIYDAAIARLRTALGLQRTAEDESLNRRGVYYSGITSDVHDKLNQNELTAEQAQEQQRTQRLAAIQSRLGLTTQALKNQLSDLDTTGQQKIMSRAGQLRAAADKAATEQNQRDFDNRLKVLNYNLSAARANRTGAGSSATTRTPVVIGGKTYNLTDAERLTQDQKAQKGRDTISQDIINERARGTSVGAIAAGLRQLGYNPTDFGLKRSDYLTAPEYESFVTPDEAATASRLRAAIAGPQTYTPELSVPAISPSAVLSALAPVPLFGQAAGVLSRLLGR